MAAAVEPTRRSGRRQGRPAMRPLRGPLERLPAPALAILLAATLAGCGSSPTSEARPGPSSPATSPAMTSSVATNGSTPGTAVGTTVPGDPAAVQPHQATAATGPCALSRVRDDFTDFPVQPNPYPIAGTLEPPDGAVEVSMPGIPRALSRSSNWFVVTPNGLAHLDPQTASADVVFTAGACSVAFADATEEEVAAMICEPSDDVALRGCSIIVASIGDGTTIGAWAVDAGEAVGGIALDDGSLVVVERYQRSSDDEIAPGRVLHLDAPSGTGTALSPTFCGNDPDLDRPIGRTALVIATCTTSSGQQVDQRTVVIDGRTGAVLKRDAYLGSTFDPTSDGTVVQLSDGTRYDAETFAPIGPPDIAPDVLSAIAPDPASTSIRVYPAQGVLWIWRVQSPPDAAQQVEIAVIDGATGDVLQRWLVGTEPGYVSRAPEPTSSFVVSADADGAWIQTDGVLHRLDRS